MSRVVDLIDSIKHMKEAQLWNAFAKEMEGDARPYILSRIYGRASRLRADRERADMAQAVVNAANR